ncbi:hypothetical protein NHG33_05355 [Aerococcaceae bacterium NML130460]|nr:hypothetical protein [Aerococcaceae bacterium NML171108]MCW6680609.1 hypothetical protein [Aerococcaceae bacterium NML130460]
MTQTIQIICNLRSGAGQSTHTLQEVQSLLQEFQIPSQTHITQYRTHAVTLAKNIVQTNPYDTTQPVIVIGGDGTLHEVVSGLYATQVLRPIIYVPAGTGNDFHRTWQANKSTRDIIRHVLGESEPTNIPIFLHTDHTTGVTDILLNNMGFGLDAEINIEAKRLQKTPFFANKLTYKLSYTAAIWHSLKKLRPVNLTISVDGQEPFSINQVPLACVMNTPFLGGGIRLDNLVEPKKQEISLIAFHDITFTALIDLIRRVFITRDQHLSSHVKRYTGKELRLQLSAPIRSHVDGEDLGMVQSDISYRLSHYPFYL